MGRHPEVFRPESTGPEDLRCPVHFRMPETIFSSVFLFVSILQHMTSFGILPLSQYCEGSICVTAFCCFRTPTSAIVKHWHSFPAVRSTRWYNPWGSPLSLKLRKSAAVHSCPRSYLTGTNTCSGFCPIILPIREEPKNITAAAAMYAPKCPAAKNPLDANQPPPTIPNDTTDKATAAMIPKIPLPPLPPFSMAG